MIGNDKTGKKMGRTPIDEELKKNNRIVVLLDNGMYSKAKRRAKENHMTMSAYITSLILKDKEGDGNV